MQNQTFPANIPAPKFQLFQRVRVGKIEATITGMEYIDFLTALLCGHNRKGWSYVVSAVHGRPEDELLNGAALADARFNEWEEGIAPAEAFNN